MIKSIQQFLRKYHKQSLLKDEFAKINKRKLEVVNKHESIFEVKNEMDAILLDVYYTSTQNKEALQKAFEKARNQVFDIWPNLTNTQKNHLLHVECAAVYESLPHFYRNDSKIYVAFFDELYNALFDKRPVVFELDQFFKLYKSYAANMIDVSYYTHYPFLAKFSECHLVHVKDQMMMLYHKKANILFEVDNFKVVKRFPLFNSAVDDRAIETFAQHIINNDVEEMKKWLLTNDVLHKKAMKATSKKAFINISEV